MRLGGPVGTAKRQPAYFIRRVGTREPISWFPSYEIPHSSIIPRTVILSYPLRTFPADHMNVFLSTNNLIDLSTLSHKHNPQLSITRAYIVLTVTVWTA